MKSGNRYAVKLKLYLCSNFSGWNILCVFGQRELCLRIPYIYISCLFNGIKSSNCNSKTRNITFVKIFSNLSVLSQCIVSFDGQRDVNFFRESLVFLFVQLQVRQHPLKVGNPAFVMHMHMLGSWRKWRITSLIVLLFTLVKTIWTDLIRILAAIMLPSAMVFYELHINSITFSFLTINFIYPIHVFRISGWVSCAVYEHYLSCCPMLPSVVSYWNSAVTKGTSY